MGCVKTQGDLTLVNMSLAPPKKRRPARRRRRAVIDFHCPTCGVTVPDYPNYSHTCPGPQAVGYQEARASTCEECEHNRDGVCLPLSVLHPNKPCLIEIGVKMPGVKCPTGKWGRVSWACDKCGSVRFDANGLTKCPTCYPPAKQSQPPASQSASQCPIHVKLPHLEPVQIPGVEIVTFHFNPGGFRRLSETYYEWLPTLGHPVTCYELVMGDGEPEIEGSVVIRGDERNAIWQKERMINLAISQLKRDIRYIAWVDHDLVFQNSRWLEQAVEKIDSGADAIQPFERINYLNLDRRAVETKRGSIASWLKGRGPGNCPGAAWVASREFLARVGGVYDRNIVGGGDATWFSAVTNQRRVFLDRQPIASQVDMQEWIDRAKNVKFDYVPGAAYHLWHGDRKNRQYISRDGILRDYGFDPHQHIELDSNGLLAWTEEAPAGLRSAVRDYFAGRQEDG